MKKSFFQRILLLMAIIGFTNASVLATDGYFSTGYGTINKSLAGAGIAYYQASLINGNPAGVVHLGKKYHIGVALFNPNRSFLITGEPSGAAGPLSLSSGGLESDSKYFVIPSFGANWMITDNSSFSIALFGNGGMNTDYPINGFFDPTPGETGVDLAQLFSNLTYSIKISDGHSLGITATLGYQYFEANGLDAFGTYGFSNDPENLSGNGASNSFGYGVKVGYLGKITETLSIGATYQSKVYMTEFEEYAGLFAEQGDFDIPSSWTVGLSWDVNDEFTVMADYKRINYTDVKSVSNPMLGPEGLAGFRLGLASGPGFGWQDINIVKAGFAYSGFDTWIFRAGGSFGDNPIGEDDVLFNILAPGVITTQVSAGFSKDLEKRRRGRRYRSKSDGKQVHFAVNYAIENTVEGSNQLDPSQTIEIGMNQIELEIGFSF